MMTTEWHERWERHAWWNISDGSWSPSRPLAPSSSFILDTESSGPPTAPSVDADTKLSAGARGIDWVASVHQPPSPPTASPACDAYTQLDAGGRRTAWQGGLDQMSSSSPARVCAAREHPRKRRSCRVRLPCSFLSPFLLFAPICRIQIARATAFRAIYISI
ncbi:hypothetical protein C8F01DRAFT_1172932 [Mycena amicta]|nr:hypothetical protein C8F01DRAFT_1172932 [Mycena amicta]